jgi:hypothetical protein
LVHTVPPACFKDLTVKKGQQETALIKKGKKIKGTKFPTIEA